MSIPDRIIAGDTLEFGLDAPDFRPAAGWTLKYRLVPRFSTPVQAPITLTATPNGTIGGRTYDYVVTATPATTAAWQPGEYGWARWVEKTGARQTLDDLESNGRLTVVPDPATLAQGADMRSPARRALDDALAAYRDYMASKSTVAEYQIGDRRMTFRAPADFVQQIEMLRREVAREERIKRMAAGFPDPRQIYVRCGRA